MRLGTQIEMSDGRVGTCVYNGLDGEGVRWGLWDPDPTDFEDTTGGTISDPPKPADWPWRPEAMLRDHFPGADLPCVGRDFVVLRYGLGEP